MGNNQGVLYVVATPIGNAEDITLRACKVLSQVSLILSEHPIRTRQLLKKLNINPPEIMKLFVRNEARLAPQIIQKIKMGWDVAIVSDSGTPVISDPGFLLVKSAMEEGIRVVPVPGPSAVITALSCSGISPQPFVFEGFLPKKPGKRKKKIKEIASELRTVVFFESPYRVRRTLEELLEYAGPNRMCCVARELTKQHEEFIYGTIQQVLEVFKDKEPRGEFVIVLEGKK